MMRSGRLLSAAVTALLAVVVTSAWHVDRSADAELVGDVQIDAIPQNVLAAVLRFESSEPTRARVRVVGPGHRFVVREKQKRRHHEVPVIGLRPERDYRLTVELESGDTSESATFTTGAVPSELPPITVSADAKRTARGWTLFSLTRRQDPPVAPGAQPPSLGYLVAVDRTGEVVWYHEAPSPIGDARLLPDGHILYEYNNMAAREIDALGNVVVEWAGRLVRGRLAQDQFDRPIAGPEAIAVDTDSLHHDIGLLPNGNLIALSTELHTVDGFTEPQCGEPPDQFTGSYQLIADVAVEFEPDTGNVVREWPLADVVTPEFDPADSTLCGAQLPQVVPTFLYADRGDVRDWTHGNAVVLDEERNALLVSVRHLDAILAFRYETDDEGLSGELLWQLGPNGDLGLRNDGDWQYHQHSPEIQADGSLLIYDNGNERPGTDEASADSAQLPYSRAVLYELRGDGPVPSAIEQVWEFRSAIDGAPAYAFFVGDTDRLANGNVLITNGGVMGHPSGVGIQLVEVIPRGDKGGEVVFELRVPSEDWFAYRAERVPAMVADGTARK